MIQIHLEFEQHLCETPVTEALPWPAQENILNTYIVLYPVDGAVSTQHLLWAAASLAAKPDFASSSFIRPYLGDPSALALGVVVTRHGH